MPSAGAAACPTGTSGSVAAEASKPRSYSDVCVVPAGGVAGEAMVAAMLAGAMLEKFGGDSIEETRRNFDGYQRQLDNF